MERETNFLRERVKLLEKKLFDTAAEEEEEDVQGLAKLDLVQCHQNAATTSSDAENTTAKCHDFSQENSSTISDFIAIPPFLPLSLHLSPELESSPEEQRARVGLEFSCSVPDAAVELESRLRRSESALSLKDFEVTELKAEVDALKGEISEVSLISLG